VSEAFVAGFFMWFEKFAAALVDRYLASVKDDETRKRLLASVELARTARTRSEKSDAARKITDAF
jgi:hypothetical protein